MSWGKFHVLLTMYAQGECWWLRFFLEASFQRLLACWSRGKEEIIFQKSFVRRSVKFSNIFISSMHFPSNTASIGLWDHQGNFWAVFSFQIKGEIFCNTSAVSSTALRPLKLATFLGGDTRITVAFELSFSLLYSYAKQQFVNGWQRVESLLKASWWKLALQFQVTLGFSQSSTVHLHAAGSLVSSGFWKLPTHSKRPHNSFQADFILVLLRFPPQSRIPESFIISGFEISLFLSRFFCSTSITGFKSQGALDNSWCPLVTGLADLYFLHVTNTVQEITCLRRRLWRSSSLTFYWEKDYLQY